MADEPAIYDVTLQYGIASVTLRRWLWLPTPANPRLEASRMRVEVTASSNVPKELFVWERHVVYTEGPSQAKDRVLCVAKASDLSVYPVDNPDPTAQIPPFYRTAVFDVPFSSPTDLSDTWNDILQSFNQLLKALVDLGLVQQHGS